MNGAHAASKYTAGKLVADMHSHFLLGGYLFRRDFFESHRPPAGYNPFRSFVDYPRVSGSGVGLLTFTCYRPGSFFGSRRTWRGVNRILDFYHRILDEGKGKLVSAATASDVESARRRDLTACLPALEGGHPLGCDAGRLEKLKNRGVRMITLTHFTDNAIADSGWDPRRSNRGLSGFGGRVVDGMNRLGMIIDIAHCSGEAFEQVLERSGHPVICSHTGLREFRNSRRNLSARQIEAIGACGGVVGIIFHRIYLGSPAWSADIDTVADSIMRVVEIAGEDTPAIGTDFDGFTWAPAGIKGYDSIEPLAAGLVERGMTESGLEKFLGLNYLRVIRAVCG